METLARRFTGQHKKVEPRSRKEKSETFLSGEKKRKAVMLSKQLLIVSGGEAAALKNRREQREKMNSQRVLYSWSFFDGFSVKRNVHSTLLERTKCNAGDGWSFRKKNAPERIWHLPKLTGNSLDHKDHRKNAWEILFEETHVSSTNSVFSQFYYQEEGVWKCQELKNYMVWW